MITAKSKSGLVDVGVHIGGSRKDMRRNNFREEDLAQMSEGEQAKYLTKSRIWPTLNWAAMKEAGVEQEVAAVIYAIRSSLKTDAAIGHRFHAQTADAYGRLVIGLRDECAEWKTTSDIETFTQKLIANQHPLSSLIKLASISGSHVQWDNGASSSSIHNPREMFSGFAMQDWFASFGPHNDTELYSPARLVNTIISISRRELRRSEYYNSFPYNERETKGLDFYGYQAYKQEARRASRKKSNLDDSPEQIRKKELKAYQKAVVSLTEEDKKIKSKNLADWRGRWDVDAETFRAAFGFAGVEFGEYVGMDRRRDMVNAAYDALSDLASILNMPRSMISLPVNQKKQVHPALSAAFGARGHGGSRNHYAHYEPVRHVFNLTRDKGLGAIAHEWGHGLDMSLGDGLDYLSSGKKAGPQTGEMGETLCKKMAAVIHAIKYRSDLDAGYARECIDKEAYTKMKGFLSWGDVFLPGYERIRKDAEEIAQDLNDFYALIKEGIMKILPEEAPAPSWKQGSRYTGLSLVSESALRETVKSVLHHYREQKRKKGATFSVLTNRHADSASNWLYNMIPLFEARSDLQNAPSPQDVSEILSVFDIHKVTKFYSNAMLLDGDSKKIYWASTVELFARAFESYIWDKLAEQNKVAPALSLFSNPDRVLPFKGMPSAFPSGKEREDINRHLDSLMDSVRRLYEIKGYDIKDVPKTQEIQTDTELLKIVGHKQAFALEQTIETDKGLLTDTECIQPRREKTVVLQAKDQLNFDF